MKLLKYLVIPCVVVLAGCSDDVAETQPVEKAQVQESSDNNQAESEGALNHFSGSIDMANEASKMQKEADRKRKEAEGAI